MLAMRRPAEQTQISMIGEIELSNAALLTEMEVLRSNLLLERVVQTLALHTLPEFLPLGPDGLVSPIPPSLVEVTQELQSRIEILREGSSYAINVLTIKENPELSAAISNEIARQYIQLQVEQRQGAAGGIADWLDDRITTMRQRVDVAEEQVERLRAENLDGEGTGPEAVARQLQSWSDILAQSRADLAAQEARLQEFHNMRASGSGDATAMVEGNATVATLPQRLADLSALKAERLVTFGDDNDRVTRIDEREEVVRRELVQAVERHLTSMRAEAAAGHVRELEQRTQELSGRSLQLWQMEREAASLQQVYGTLLTHLNANDAQKPLPHADARIIYRADPPQRPSAPRVKLTTVLGDVLGLGGGLGLALLSEEMRRTYRSREDIETDLRLLLLTTLPQGRWGRRRPLLDWMKRSEGLQFAEAVRQLRTALMFSPAREAKVIMIASAGFGEGRTTIALALASLFAGIGKRVLDDDLRRPGVAAATRRSPPAGLAQILAGAATPSQAILRDAGLGFDLLAEAPPAPADVAEPDQVDALSTPAFRGLIDGLRRDYDLVIVDTAPLLHASDAIAIGRLADASLVVVREGTALADDVRQSLARLLEMRIPVVGVALNASRSVASAPYRKPLKPGTVPAAPAIGA